MLSRDLSRENAKPAVKLEARRLRSLGYALGQAGSGRVGSHICFVCDGLGRIS